MSDFDDSDFENHLSRCNYCNTFSKLAPGKQYCGKCKERCYRECKRCKKPYDNAKYFTEDHARCNSCQAKFLKEREKRQQKRLAAKDTEIQGPSKKFARSTSSSEREPQVEPDEKANLINFLPSEMKDGKIVAYIPVIFAPKTK